MGQLSRSPRPPRGGIPSIMTRAAALRCLMVVRGLTGGEGPWVVVVEEASGLWVVGGERAGGPRRRAPRPGLAVAAAFSPRRARSLPRPAPPAARSSSSPPGSPRSTSVGTGWHHRRWPAVATHVERTRLPFPGGVLSQASAHPDGLGGPRWPTSHAGTRWGGGHCAFPGHSARHLLPFKLD